MDNSFFRNARDILIGILCIIAILASLYFIASHWSSNVGGLEKSPNRVDMVSFCFTAITLLLTILALFVAVFSIVGYTAVRNNALDRAEAIIHNHLESDRYKKTLEDTVAKAIGNNQQKVAQANLSLDREET